MYPQRWIFSPNSLKYVFGFFCLLPVSVYKFERSVIFKANMILQYVKICYYSIIFHSHLQFMRRQCNQFNIELFKKASIKTQIALIVHHLFLHQYACHQIVSTLISLYLYMYNVVLLLYYDWSLIFCSQCNTFKCQPWHAGNYTCQLATSDWLQKC